MLDAIERHKDLILAETLADRLSLSDDLPQPIALDVNGTAVTASLSKV